MIATVTADTEAAKRWADFFREPPDPPPVYVRSGHKSQEMILVDQALVDQARHTLGIDCVLKLSPSYSGYAATEDGRAVSFHWSNRVEPRRFRILDARLDDRGYYVIKAHLKPRPRNLRVHLLVADAFGLVRLPEHTEVRHLDGNSTNNKPTNLAWGTHVENVGDQILHDTHAAGERNGHAKLTEGDVREIRRLRSEGVKIADLSERFGVVQGIISSIAHHRIWRCVK